MLILFKRKSRLGFLFSLAIKLSLTLTKMIVCLLIFRIHDLQQNVTADMVLNKIIF